MHLRRALVELAVRRFVVELLMAAIWQLLIHDMVMQWVLRRYERWPSSDVARRVVGVSHPCRLLRLVRVEFLGRHSLGLESLLLLLHLLDELGLILVAFVVLHEVAGRVLDHEVLRLVLGALRQRLVLRRIVQVKVQGLHRKALLVQVMAL